MIESPQIDADLEKTINEVFRQEENFEILLENDNEENINIPVQSKKVSKKTSSTRLSCPPKFVPQIVNSPIKQQNKLYPCLNQIIEEDQKYSSDFTQVSSLNHFLDEQPIYENDNKNIMKQKRNSNNHRTHLSRCSTSVSMLNNKNKNVCLVNFKSLHPTAPSFDQLDSGKFKQTKKEKGKIEDDKENYDAKSTKSVY
jgi:hypothetical protein